MSRLAVLLLLFACSPDFVGNWSDPDTGRAIAFKSNFVVEALDGGEIAQGTWSKERGDRVRINFGSISSVADVRVEGDTLTIEGMQQGVLVFQRDTRTPQRIRDER